MLEQISIEAIIDTANSVQTIGELKQSLRDLKSAALQVKEGSKEFDNLTLAAAKAKDKLDDVNKRIIGLDPDKKFAQFAKIGAGIANGFAAAQGAAALFGKESEDVQKTLLKVQAAMAFSQGIQGVRELGKEFKILGTILKANPLLLIATVIVGIGTALFALKDKIPVVGAAFDAIGKVIGFVTDKIKNFSDWLGLSSFKADEAGERVIKAAKKQQQSITERYDTEIALANAAGKKTEELEIKKQKAVLASIKIQTDALIAQFKLHGKFTDEQQKAFDELILQSKNAALQIAINETKIKKEKSEEQKKRNDELIKDKKERSAEQKKIDDERISEGRKAEEDYDKWLKNLRQGQLDFEKLRKETEIKFATDAENAIKKVQEDAIKDKEEKKKEQEEKEKEAEENKIKLQTDTFNAINSLSSLFFQSSLNLAHGNESKMKQIRKRQFNFEKGIAATQTTIATIQTVQNELKKGFPVGTILAGLAAVTGAANVSAILSKKFPEGGGVDTSLPSPSGGGITSDQSGGLPRNILEQTKTTNLQTDKQGNLDNSHVIRAFVVETDITSSQKRIQQIQQNATI